MTTTGLNFYHHREQEGFIPGLNSLSILEICVFPIPTSRNTAVPCTSVHNELCLILYYSTCDAIAVSSSPVMP